MVINTKQRILMFVVVVTGVAAVLAEALSLIIYPKEVLSSTMWGTLYISVLVTVPISFWVGRQMLEKALMAQQLQDLVDRDRLTDVATRDFFFSRLTADPDAYGASLMVDIDHFKQVNDTHGHLAGDVVIHRVAQILRNHTRDKDIVCRFGGEEFLVFLHQAQPAEAYRIAERIRSGAQETTVTTAAGDIKVTVSVGGSLKERIEHIDDAIRRADACLYKAKRMGRNRSVMDWDATKDEAA